jgi:PAS domain S-box-containing protein
MTEEHRPGRIEWHKTEERFRLLVESVKDYGIFTLDTQGYITSWNEGARRIKGYEAHEIIGSHFSRFYPPEDVAAKKPEWELEQAIKDGRVEDEGWRLRKDGTRFWADVIITALVDPDTGELRGFGKVTRDLTERKHAEERLRQSEEQFRLLVERVEEYAIFMLDPTGHIVTWNTGAEKIKGYAVEEIVGEHFERFYTPEDRASGKPGRLLREAERVGHVRDQGRRMRKDGTTFHADVLITAVHDAKGALRGFSKVTRDISDQLRTREIEAARIAAEKANKAKDDFLAVLSHELRTPLTPVIAGTRYLAEHAATVSQQELIEELNAIRRNALLEAQLIDDLLDLTRISRGKIELRYEVVDVHAALRDALEICQEDIAAKGLEVSRDFAAQEHWTWADPTRIRQVFWNLLNNAVKFTPAGGEIRIRSADGPVGQIVVEVADTGVGIEAEQSAQIFNAFEQGERTVTRQFGGLGLGLTITRSLVEMHGGAIAVHSPGKGEGTTFTVTLARLPQQIVEAQQGSAPAASTPMPSLRILLVDDHDDTRRILSRLLAKQGHHVEAASDVKTALARLAAEPFDLLISDIGLPDGSGLDLMKAASAASPRLHGIALSGFGMEEDIRRSSEAGFEFHVTKPVDFTVLQKLLTRIVPG